MNELERQTDKIELRKDRGKRDRKRIQKVS